MADKTSDLDKHRGMAAQKATDLRRLLAEVKANETALRLRLEELESHLIAVPGRELARSCREGALSASNTLAAEDPRRQKLIAAVLDAPINNSARYRL